jgi:hypothetical protein
MNIGESVLFSNLSATPAQFALEGGEYAMFVSATWGGGSVTLQGLAADGTTLVSLMPAFTSNGYGYLDLPPGQYTLAVATATAVYISICRVPV